MIRRSVVRRTSARLAAGGLAAAVALVGCSTPPPKDAGIAPTPTPTVPELPVQASPSPTATPATLDQQREVRAVVERWQEALNTSLRTLDPTAAEALFLPECEACRGTLDYVRQLKRAGQRVEGGEVSLTGEPTVTVTGDTASARLSYRVAPIRVYESNGKLAYTEPAFRDSEIVQLRRHDAGWRIFRIDGPAA